MWHIAHQPINRKSESKKKNKTKKQKQNKNKTKEHLPTPHSLVQKSWCQLEVFNFQVINFVPRLSLSLVTDAK